MDHRSIKATILSQATNPRVRLKAISILPNTLQLSTCNTKFHLRINHLVYRKMHSSRLSLMLNSTLRHNLKPPNMVQIHTLNLSSQRKMLNLNPCKPKLSTSQIRSTILILSTKLLKHTSNNNLTLSLTLHSQANLQDRISQVPCNRSLPLAHIHQTSNIDHTLLRPMHKIRI